MHDSLPESNLLGIAFLPSLVEEYVLAILHIDHMDRTQLLSREIRVHDLELAPSTLLHPTAISSKMIPNPADLVPKLLPAPAMVGEDDESLDFRGGVLIVGGVHILLFELASDSERQRQAGKAHRSSRDRKSGDPKVSSAAIDKEQAREGRKRKAKASIEWPWGEVTA